jgi:hypothetical protein
MTPDPIIGRVIGSYRVLDKIGEGGMGAVYRDKFRNAQLPSRQAVASSSFRHSALGLRYLAHQNAGA